MTTEQWLTDLEAKAKAAVANWEKKYGDESDEAITQLAASMGYIDAANPAAVLRLVGMVRAFAAHCAELGCPHRCPISDAPSLEECASCWITHVHNAGGGSHD